MGDSAAMDNGIWPGLLKWSLQHVDGTAPSEFSAMSEEDRKWLEQVMREGVRDENKRLKEIMVAVSE